MTGLREADYGAYLVGGCVRDLLLGREPKDFDVVTDAHPEQIRTLFRSTRLIGRRFRLAHVHFGRDIIEVATFRANPDLRPNAGEDDPEDGNVFGNQEQDAYRRDFTVNSLYYDIETRAVIDYVGGLEDLKRGLLRVIGDPEQRYREDPVRMLRAIRFAGKLGLTLEPKTAAPLRDLAFLLTTVPPARLFEEMLKLFQSGYAAQTYALMREYGLFQELFPLTERGLEEDNAAMGLLLPRALENTDRRIAEDKPVTPAFLFAALLWPAIALETKGLDQAANRATAWVQAVDFVVREQVRIIALPKRFSFPMREIWEMQPRFARRHGRNPFRLLENKRFRAAYDFLLLRAEIGEEAQELAQWWTDFQTADGDARERMVDAIQPPETVPGVKKSRRRRRRRRG